MSEKPPFRAGRKENGEVIGPPPLPTPRGSYFFFFVAFLAAFFFAGIREIPPFGPELDGLSPLKQHLG